MKVLVRRGEEVHSYDAISLLLCLKSLKDGQLDIQMIHEEGAPEETRVSASVLMAHAALSTVAVDLSEDDNG
jgi:hypothetical protein